jgi:hypothetical protein
MILRAGREERMVEIVPVRLPMTKTVGGLDGLGRSQAIYSPEEAVKFRAH